MEKSKLFGSQNSCNTASSVERDRQGVSSGLSPSVNPSTTTASKQRHQIGESSSGTGSSRPSLAPGSAGERAPTGPRPLDAQYSGRRRDCDSDYGSGVSEDSDYATGDE